jgi:tetrahydromethanopterin S-methyltransferase subunit G
VKTTVTKYFAISIIILGSFALKGQTNENTPVPFTLADRDRIMRTEQRLDALEKIIDERFGSVDERFFSLQRSMDERFESQQKQLDNIYTLLFFILGGVMSLMGFVIYDRRTAIKPVQREQETLIKVMREYSEKHNDLAEILKKAGVL